MHQGGLHARSTVPRLIFVAAAALTLWQAATEGLARGGHSVWPPFGAANTGLLEQREDIESLRSVLDLNPRNSRVWIRLGLEHERRNDPVSAEQALLQASRIDRQYLPAWTLANFYFRRTNHPEFWKWARRAAELTYDDYRPLLRLADAVEPAPQQVLTNLGHSPGLMRAYVDFLIGEQRLGDAQQIALKILENRDPADTPRLADLVNRHIAAGDESHALALWSRLDRPPAGSGFDWRFPGCPGISFSKPGSQIRFELDGSQQDGCVLIERYIPSHRPPLELRFSSSAFPGGFRWIFDGREVPFSAPQPIVFAPQNKLARLSLSYRRDPGIPRFSGSLTIRDLALE